MEAFSRKSFDNRHKSRRKNNRSRIRKSADRIKQEHNEEEDVHKDLRNKIIDKRTKKIYQNDCQKRPRFENNQYNDKHHPNLVNNRGKKRPNIESPNLRPPKMARTMGFLYVENLLKEDDISVVIFNLSNDKNGFSELLDKKDISKDLIILIIQLIRKFSESAFLDVKVNLLNVVLQSGFIDKLIDYISNIVNQKLEDKERNNFFWKDPDDFWNNLLLISTTVSEVIPSNCECIQKVLNTMKAFFPLIESTHSIQIAEELKTRMTNLLDIVLLKINDLEVKRIQKQCKIDNNKGLTPPEDFREIEIIPNSLEVTIDQSPFLRPNVVDKPYKSVDEYLDIHFRLLREDFVAPLRRGICAYLKHQNKPQENKKKLDNIKVYSAVRFLDEEFINECNSYRIQLTFAKKNRTMTYENSRRFLFGSLVCFTKDNFKTLLFGKIVKKDPELLKRGILIISFQEQVDIHYNVDYLMVESTVYFEPYYQTLGVLKNINSNDFPMQKYIIRVETDTHPPRYLKQEMPVSYKVEGFQFCPLEFPAEKTFYGFNKSQQNAFQAALTKEFCVIQGPPGTGKTFLGLKVVQTLLLNIDAWYKCTPILIICFTNHALDQFLEGLLSLEVTDKVLRVGSQSKNQNLEEYNLVNHRRNLRHQQPAIRQKYFKVRDSMENIKILENNLNQIKSNETILNFKHFKSIIEDYESTMFAEFKEYDMKMWLLEDKSYAFYNRIRDDNIETVPSGNQKLDSQEDVFQEDNKEDIDCDEDWRHVDLDDDVFHNITIKKLEVLFSLQQMRDHKRNLYKKLSKATEFGSKFEIGNIQYELFETEAELNYVSDRLAYYQKRQNRRPPQHVDMNKPFEMHPADRWALYFQWIEQYTRCIKQKYREAKLKFKDVIRVYNELRNMEDTQIMKTNLVVGMTTTAAARLQSSLRELKSPIVIVEEAAEVLEAHIVAALTSNCKHLILIGDHLQLKPTSADYRMEKNFKLGISLFERMVNNKIQCHTLNVQHRMRPEISSLVKPSIYPDLEDHESTLQRPPILGIETPLYFIDHQEKEEICEDASKKNVHEAKFLIALARHLILNEYKPEQITILVAYLGQKFEMVRERNKPCNKNLLQDVRIAVLDNYQGEESDIILLSLVRSNTENIAGFLKIQNRVCVALSRARNGLYIMGNMSVLLHCKSENEIWEKVHKTLKDQMAIGPFLTLKCQVHTDKLTQVSKSDDFKKICEGGCELFCNTKVFCGHMCKQLCHVRDRDHNTYKCFENCTRTLCDDPQHVCRKLCYKYCGPCTYIVERELICGHKVALECNIDINTYNCKEKVRVKLPCDHEAEKPCYIDPNVFDCPHPCEIRVEPCGHSCKRTCHIRDDPDHLKYICTQPCAKPRIGCKTENPHRCRKLCCDPCQECQVKVTRKRSCGHKHTIPCKQDIENVKCEVVSRKVLPCGHPRWGKCFIESPCLLKVTKVNLDCGHEVTVSCSKTPERRDCNVRTCPRLLPCGHKCTKSCKEDCTKQCKVVVDCDITTPCGHTLTKIQCHLKNNAEPEDFLNYCTEPCGIELECKHKCSGTCGTCMQSRIHKRCTKKCGVPLICNHECSVPCREACKPCTKRCEMKCSHSKCSKVCGEPCTLCKEECSRRCKHVKCTNLCGEICNVTPCMERCNKLLKCLHPCVGFCGDPCPVLCRVCDNEKLTEIFLGSEDDPNAIYVMLTDCEHVFEYSDLNKWFMQDDGEIKLKVCPRCKTTVTSTHRYSNYIKEALRDIISVKRKSYGTFHENEKFRNELEKELKELQAYIRHLRTACPQLVEVFNILHTRLLPAKNCRRQPINNIELNAIKSKIQTLNYITNCFKDGTVLYDKDDKPISHLNILLKVILRSEDQITNQEVKDLKLEIKRLNRIVQINTIKKLFKHAENDPQISKLEKDIEDVLFAKKRYSTDLDGDIKSKLEDLSHKVNSKYPINDTERVQIVAAIGLAKGHWFKCPNGHPYAIGECGGAMQVAKCFCGAQIGGSGHRLLPTNQHAPEMDGSNRHAWPGGLH